MANVLDETHEALMIVGGLVDGIPEARYAMTDPTQRERAQKAGEEVAAAWRHLSRAATQRSDRAPRHTHATESL
jgi:hypothetical protein